MAQMKSPGPNDFNPNFYQKYWHIVNEEVSSFVLKFFNDDIFDSRINFTYIALIPKVKCPVRVSDFQSISLCNVIYKLVSKVLVNRLKQILPFMISKNQSAFISGRLIIDNINMAYEALYSIKTRHKGQKGSMAIKLYISKTYDKLE